jgi:hypothetical protein
MEVKMANSVHVEWFKKGSKSWNAWLAEQRALDGAFRADLSDAELFWAHPADLRGSDLRDANLQAANLGALDLTGADFRGANLDNTVIQRAQLAEAHLQRAQLRRANLFKTDLSHSNLTGADCSGADLRETDLCGTIFDRTTLSDADFSGAQMNRTKLCDLDLSDVKGLASVVNIAFSTVGMDTLQRSKACIPHRFLEGAGIPKELLAGTSFADSERAYYSCFISHSSKDESFTDKLMTDLKARGVRCWFNDLDGGRHLIEQIDEAICRHDKVLLVLSSNSIESPWVETEIYKARERELRENIQVLFPILIGSYSVLDSWKCPMARDIREYYIPYFTNWKDPESYRRTFERLLLSLAQSKDQRRAAA